MQIFFYAKITKQSQSHNIKHSKKSTAGSHERAANQYILTYEKTFLLLLTTKTTTHRVLFDMQSSFSNNNSREHALGYYCFILSNHYFFNSSINSSILSPIKAEHCPPSILDATLGAFTILPFTRSAN